MTDIYQGTGSGATSVLTPPPSPEWIAEPPPWTPSWTPPTAAGGAGGDGGFGPVGPLPGWQPPPPEAPRKRGPGGIAVVIAAALVSAAIGLGIGSRLGRSTSAPVAAASTPAISPAPAIGGTTPSGGTTPTPSGGTTPTQPATGSVPSDAAAIATKVTPGIVDINIQLGYQGGAAAGTGMVLTSSGEVLTNNHVVKGATTISVTIPSTRRTYSATVVGTDPTEDVAVIQLRGASGLKTIPIGNSGTVTSGDAVVAMGNAGGVGGAPSVVTGTVQAVDQTITASDQGGGNAETLTGLIQTNTPIQPGDSGGPLANNQGQVIGMDTAASSARRFSGGAPVSFAIPINRALSIAQQIESGQASSTVHIGQPAFLGVSLSASSVGSGALVTGVASGTPAAGAGMAAGDAITAINGTSVTSASGLTAAMQGHRPGDRVTVAWTTQAGTSRTATITLGAGPAD
ncbi:MAG: S1C family serine protease [Actinomycetota bacterium]|nr:S1C family serine protease [Actinomycetota bacterium]